MVAYKLKLPEDSRVHLVFHVSLLQKSVAGEQIGQPLPPCVIEEWELQAQPEDILAVRGQSRKDLELFVKWKGLAECENSWEPFEKMKEEFPELHLEDKVFLKGEGIDENTGEGEPKVTKVYERGKWKLETH